MKSLLVGTRCHLCKVYNYHGSQACSYKRFGILTRLDGMVWVWFWFSLCGTFVILCALLWIIFCDIL
jgi:hypothetical protein